MSKSAGWYAVEHPTTPLTFVRREISNYPHNGPKGKVRIAYAHAVPDYALSPVTPARLSPLSPPFEFISQSECWQVNLRWMGTNLDCPASAVAVFTQYPEIDQRWHCRLAPADFNGSFLFNLRGPGDFIYGGGHTAVWGPGSWGDFHQWPKDFSLSPPNAPPAVTVRDLPNVAYEATYTYRVINGETDPAPPIVIPAHPFNPNLYAPAVLKLLAPTPPGTYGVYLYLRRLGETQWHCQPWHFGRSCWPSFVSELHLTGFQATNIGPNPAKKPKAWLNGIQAELGLGDASDCTTDEDEMDLVCPIVSPQRGKSRTFGGRWGVVVFRVPQTIKDEDGHDIAVPREWDALCIEESNYLTWRNFRLEAEKHDVYAFAAWASHSYSAANCFGPRLENLYLTPNGKSFSVGVCVSKYSNGNLGNDHTCSEMVADDATIFGHVGWHIAGGQSVNFKLTSPGAFHGRALETPDSCSFHFDVTGGQFVLDGHKWDPSQKSTVFALDAPATVFCGGLFADGIGRALVTLGPGGGGAVIFTGAGKINCFRPAAYRFHLVEQLTARPFVLDMGRCFGQDNGNIQYAALIPNVEQVNIGAAAGTFFAQKTVKAMG
jgi:hypothetical protein